MFRPQAPALNIGSGEDRDATLSQLASLNDIMQALFRANPEYELILFDHLAEAYQKQFSSLIEDGDFYGVLWPHTPDLVVKAVDRETALLFFTMQQVGPIPTYVRSKFGEHCNQAIAKLVLDGVLEIALEPEGPFASGAAAFRLIYEPKVLSSTEGRIAGLSMDAIEYGQTIEIESSAELSARLYFYNTVPASPSWHKLIPTSDAVLAFLGIDAKGRNHRIIDRYYHLLPSAQNGAGWHIWRLRREQVSRRATWRPTHKLYISPRPEALPENISSIVEVLGIAMVSSFKIGRDLYGLLRPDKIVAYCGDFEELAVLAARLQEVLADCPAQGVPFTAGIDPAGLLTWGKDPPRETQEFAGLEQESWRLWVTNRLAVALLAGKSQSTGVKPSQFALERLRLDGVDTDTWTPKQAIWQADRRG